MNNVKLNIGDYLQYNIPIMPIKRYDIIVMQLLILIILINYVIIAVGHHPS